MRSGVPVPLRVVTLSLPASGVHTAATAGACRASACGGGRNWRRRRAESCPWGRFRLLATGQSCPARRCPRRRRGRRAAPSTDMAAVAAPSGTVAGRGRKAQALSLFPVFCIAPTAPMALAQRRHHRIDVGHDRTDRHLFTGSRHDVMQDAACGGFHLHSGLVGFNVEQRGSLVDELSFGDMPCGQRAVGHIHVDLGQDHLHRPGCRRDRRGCSRR